MLTTDLKTIDNYIKTFPKDVQSILEKIKKTIKRTTPNAEECLVYKVPAFKLNGKNLVMFAAFKNHIGFYPTPTVIDAFEKETKPYRTGKGTMQFPLDKPIPYDLIEKIVRFRAQEITS